MSVLEVRDIHRNYGKKEVLKGVTFQIDSSEIVGLIGKNGAGKSTLFKVITGILKQKSGTVKILDQEVSSKNRKIFQQVGYLIEQVSLYPHLTGYEHIQIVAKLTDTKIDEHVETLISTLKMNSYIHNKTKTYSQGMKQRLGILLAVLNKPKLLLLDEPLNGLDPEGVYEIRTFLLNLCHQEGMSLLISSHILSEMQIFCDRFLFLKDGVISKDLTKSDLKNSNLEQEFIEDNQE
ncbi:MAG: ABC transporter ATP-binding protein [Candidatus Faecenecus gallistercoris]|nr:ABC transporter ATP-binding protein [Bacillota bacterium]MDD7102755.1 ABC transporter ATP-binding protein [Bacillota bacterium]MDY4050826.1 ABC transporter ATP-binding protein [Candidatus Faecenecus gallistercoris]